MFAIQIDRCAVGWSPPILVEGQNVSRWRDRTYSIEFDTVYNDARYYENAGRQGCTFRQAKPTVARVSCWTHDGRIDDRTFDCP